MQDNNITPLFCRNAKELSKYNVAMCRRHKIWVADN